MPRKLNIGGTLPHPEWEILDIVPGPHVDHVGDARDLSRFPDNSFSAIYASHVLEHLDYKGELLAALKEWNRALEPGGKAYISVPDLDVLAQLLLAKDKLTIDERFSVMRMMFGGHEDKYDYHLVGLTRDFLEDVLLTAGFEAVSRVKEFGIFEDSSSMVFKDVLISLNVTAAKPVAAR